MRFKDCRPHIHFCALLICVWNCACHLLYTENDKACWLFYLRHTSYDI